MVRDIRCAPRFCNYRSLLRVARVARIDHSTGYVSLYVCQTLDLIPCALPCFSVLQHEHAIADPHGYLLVTALVLCITVSDKR
jgi:hypothetical protein